MGEAWQAQDERGSTVLIRLIAWIALKVGYRAGRLLLYPICLYFLVFSVTARRASADYLLRSLRRSPGMGDLFRHYFCFAATILDRPYFLTGRFDSYDIRIHGEEVLKGLVESGQGGILMGAHIGSFEVLRCLAYRQGDIDLKIMMHTETTQRIGRILNELNPEFSRDVIELGRPDSVIRAHKCISDGGFVGILADRNTKGEKCVPVRFLGTEALFPVGPAMLAAVAQCPIIAFFPIYRGGRRYDIYFERLCERVPADYRRNPETLQMLVAKFAGLMEVRCGDAPYNWFNFFDFWKDNEK
jgi:predicted LPLAT superfamily acyltransferase